VGSVITLLMAETKESEIMDTSSKQQRTYEEREMEEKREKQRVGNCKLEKSEERKKKEGQKRSKGGGKEKIHKELRVEEEHYYEIVVLICLRCLCRTTGYRWVIQLSI
jgi:hypothetical protein